MRTKKQMGDKIKLTTVKPLSKQTKNDNNTRTTF